MFVQLLTFCTCNTQKEVFCIWHFITTGNTFYVKLLLGHSVHKASHSLPRNSLDKRQFNHQSPRFRLHILHTHIQLHWEIQIFSLGMQYKCKNWVISNAATKMRSKVLLCFYLQTIRILVIFSLAEVCFLYF